MHAVSDAACIDDVCITYGSTSLVNSVGDLRLISSEYHLLRVSIGSHKKKDSTAYQSDASVIVKGMNAGFVVNTVLSSTIQAIGVLTIRSSIAQQNVDVPKLRIDLRRNVNTMMVCTI